MKSSTGKFKGNIPPKVNTRNFKVLELFKPLIITVDEWTPATWPSGRGKGRIYL